LEGTKRSHALHQDGWHDMHLRVTTSGAVMPAWPLSARTVLPAGRRRNETRGVKAMRVAIAGGLAKVLSERGDEVVALIRNPDHAGDVRRTGADPAVVDLERARTTSRRRSPAPTPSCSPRAPVPEVGRRKETMDYAAQ
jgi:hypothetical protein